MRQVISGRICLADCTPWKQSKVNEPTITMILKASSVLHRPVENTAALPWQNIIAETDLKGECNQNQSLTSLASRQATLVCLDGEERRSATGYTHQDWVPG